MKKLALYTLSLTLVFGSACTKLLDVEVPGDQLSEEDAIRSKEDVFEVLQSCYDVNANVFNGNMQNASELLADNLSMLNTSGDLGQVFARNVSIFNGSIDLMYRQPYETIFRCNRLKELAGDFDFTEEERARINAETDFLRALSHWQVTRLWAQPWGFTPDNSHNGIVNKTATAVEVKARNTLAENYAFIIEDLERAINSGGLSSSPSPYNASEAAARALLAQVLFQKGDYQEAADMASSVINSGAYQLGTEINRFQPDTVNLPEVIFKTRSYAPLTDYRSSGFTSNFRTDVPQPPFLRASRDFYNEFVNDTNDRRVQQFLSLIGDPGSPEEFVGITKFDQVYFDVPIFHLTELKLIRAEALALLNSNLTQAIEDINDLRERAYGNEDFNLSSSAAVSQILDAVRKERRIEMLGEGDRVHQLKRRAGVDGENLQIRGVDWNCPGLIMQFPAVERTELFEMNPQGGC